MHNMSFLGYYKDRKVLVTGHTGFKGAWLTEWLLQLSARVTGLALSPATDPSLFDQLGLAGRCDHRIGDIRDRALVRRVMHEVRPDLVFHLAAQPLVRLSYAQPLATYETNVMGTAHVLEALRDAIWPCAAVMITTDKVYENREWLHAYRESDPLGGCDPYSSSKACAELVIQAYRQSYFDPVRIQNVLEQKILTSSRDALDVPLVAVASARAGNVMGGGDWSPDRILPDCMRALAKGDDIVVRNPHATRPWQHVLEPLSGYLLLGMRLHDALCRRAEDGGQMADNGRHKDSRTSLSFSRGPFAALPALCSSFNFGPTISSNRSVAELVEAILKLWPGRWINRSEAGAPHEAGRLNLTADKAFHLLHWESRWNFAQTLAATVSWYRTIHQEGDQAARSLVEEQIRTYSCQDGECLH
jgi:CDP-glucose 4,6-dehydratase